MLKHTFLMTAILAINAPLFALQAKADDAASNEIKASQTRLSESIPAPCYSVVSQYAKQHLSDEISKEVYGKYARIREGSPVWEVYDMSGLGSSSENLAVWQIDFYLDGVAAGLRGNKIKENVNVHYTVKADIIRDPSNAGYIKCTVRPLN